jgi:hypothetical protein
MWRRVGFVRTDEVEERIVPIFKAENTGKRRKWWPFANMHSCFNVGFLFGMYSVAMSLLSVESNDKLA